MSQLTNKNRGLTLLQKKLNCPFGFIQGSRHFPKRQKRGAVKAISVITKSGQG